MFTFADSWPHLVECLLSFFFSRSKMCSLKKDIHLVNNITSTTYAIIVNFDDGDQFESTEFCIHLDKNFIILFHIYYIWLFLIITVEY